MSDTVNCRLSCGCWKRVDGLKKRGDPFTSTVWDVRCLFHGSATVAEVKLMEWHARCSVCRASKWFGADEESARLWARRHLDKYTSHVVGVVYDRVLKWDGVDPTTGDGSILVGREEDEKRQARKVAAAAAIKAEGAKQAAKKRAAAREKANPVVRWTPDRSTRTTALSFDDL